MKIRFWALGTALLLCACEAPLCRRMCESGLREQLIRDFGVLPQAVRCEDPKWAQPRTCAECAELLRRDYAVLPTSCEDEAFAEPASR